MQTFVQYFEPNQNNLNKILDFVNASLKSMHIEGKENNMAVFRTEDAANGLIRHATEGSRMKVSIIRSFGNVSIRMSCAGAAFDLKSEMEDYFADEVDEEVRNIIISRLSNVFVKNTKLQNRRGLNTATIVAVRRKKNTLLRSITALAVGVIVGLLIRYLCSPDVASFLSESVFATGTTLFLRAIKMTIGFTVFFSIAHGVSGFQDLSELGKLFSRVLMLFVITSVVTISLAWLVYQIHPIGNPSLQSAVESSVSIAQMDTATSAGDMLLGIIPENIVDAFLRTDMLQILFIAILTGIAVSRMNTYSQKMSQAVEILDELFLKITGLISQFMPLCIFFSMANMVLKLDSQSLLSVSGWAVMIYLCDFIVLIGLILFVLFAGRTSPQWFLKQFGSVMMAAFATASSSAIMPLTLSACKEKLNISPKIYSFSVPLGIVVNMDGGCVTLLISTLFLANVYGISYSTGTLLQLCLTVFLLSVAAPAVPGGVLLCLAALLPQAGIPVEGLTLIMGPYFLVSMVQTMTNVTSTVAVSYVVNTKSFRRNH